MVKKYFIISFIFFFFLSQSAQALTYDEIVRGQSGKVLGATIVNPELPRIYLTTSVASTPVTGQTINVPAAGDFQAALNSANLGDQIVLAAGATYSGNFILPNKTTGSGWITIRTSNMAGIPAEGVRIDPSNAPAMPKIITPNVAPAIQTDPASHNYRFIGVEIGSSAQNSYNNLNYGLVDLGAIDQVTGGNLADPATLPHDIIFDRSYIHGNVADHDKRGVTMNGYNESVVDSYISEIHGYGQDTQAIQGSNGPGPFKIVNNFLEASGENILFGGIPPAIPNNIPSDIEVRHNYFFKPLSWNLNDPSYAGRHWEVKNLFELKLAQRVLVDGNIFENNWSDAQAGYAILFQGLTADSGLWAVVKNITFTHNIINNSVSGLDTCGGCFYPPVQTTDPTAANYVDPTISRVDTTNFSNNLFENISNILVQAITNTGGMVFSHNTGINAGSTNVFDGPQDPNFTEQDNIMGHGTYGVFGSGVGEGTVALNTYTTGYNFAKNVLANSPAGTDSRYPANNYFPADWASVGFTNFSGGDYHLASNSPYKNAATDGKDIGANIDDLNAATAGVILGNGTTPPPPPTPTPTPPPPSVVSVNPTAVSFPTQVVGFTSPGQITTLYNTGSSSITVNNISVTGDFAIATNYCNNGLAPNSHCDVYLTFTPTLTGSRTGSLTFTETGVSGSPQTVSLSGKGITAIAGDLNHDNIVNTLDYSLLNSKWNQNYPAYDLLVDGLINSLDFAILKSNWGKMGQ